LIPTGEGSGLLTHIAATSRMSAWACIKNQARPDLTRCAQFPYKPRTSNGSESGGGLFPATFFASSRPAIAETQGGETEKEIIPMNPLIQLKKTTPQFFVAFGLACFGLSPAVQALSPAPDGGYPGGNTAEEQDALSSLTTGTYNSATGVFSLLSLTTGSFNTAIGAGTLLANTADKNTATGAGAF
jgi:hypothetical protein